MNTLPTRRPPLALLRLVALLIPPCFAVPSAQASNSWVLHPADYPSSPLCSEQEVTLWTCTVRHTTYSLCAQRAAVRDDFALQYRVRDRSGRIVLRYPQPLRAPASAFTYLGSANGDAEVGFAIGRYRYSLVDPLRDASSISVDKGGRSLARLSCREGNQSLQLNDTIALMKMLGVPEPR